MRSPATRLAIAVTTAAASLILPVAPAHATIAVEVKGGPRLEIVGNDAADIVDVTCEGIYVKVNGADPATGPFECSKVNVILVMTHGGADQVTLEHVDPNGAFQRLDGTGILGGEGDDTLIGSLGPDAIEGQGGTDTMIGLASYDEFSLRSDDASVSGGGGRDAAGLVNAEGDWRLTATALERLMPDPNVIQMTGIEDLTVGAGHDDDDLDASGFTGSVSLNGMAGDDTLRGGADWAQLIGMGGDDRLIGADRNDHLLAGPGDDVVRGHGGRDFINGGGGIDDCVGGPDLDRLFRCE